MRRKVEFESTKEFQGLRFQSDFFFLEFPSESRNRILAGFDSPAKQTPVVWIPSVGAVIAQLLR